MKTIILFSAILITSNSFASNLEDILTPSKEECIKRNELTKDFYESLSLAQKSRFNEAQSDALEKIETGEINNPSFLLDLIVNKSFSEKAAIKAWVEREKSIYCIKLKYNLLD